MCYEVHGYAGKYFNLVSDRCLSVNAWFTQLPNNNRINRMSEIGLLAMNDNNECLEIKIDVNNCTGTLGGTEITSNYNSNGVTIRSYVRRWRVSVPNCHPMQAVMYVYYDAMDMLRFHLPRTTRYKVYLSQEYCYYYATFPLQLSFRIFLFPRLWMATPPTYKCLTPVTPDIASSLLRKSRALGTT